MNRFFRILDSRSEKGPAASVRVKLLAQAAFAVLALGAWPALAQDQPLGPDTAPSNLPPSADMPSSTPNDSLPSEAIGPAPLASMPSGLPHDIVPPDILGPMPPQTDMPAQSAAPPVDAAAPPPVDQVSPPTMETVATPMLPRGGPVQVGDLGDVEGPIAGTLPDMEGLGASEWETSDRAVIETLLTSVPPATPSDTARLMMRRVLLTAAAPPPGRADIPFNALRIDTLLDAGLSDDAADLAEKIDAPKNPAILRAQADAFLYAGRDADACSSITASRLDSAEPFWAELRAYCYAIAGETGPLDLTRSVITEQGLADPAFLQLLDGMLSGMPQMPEALPIMDSLHVRMLARLNLPMNAQVATGMGLTASLIAAGSEATPAPLRIAAADTALRAGVLPTPLLGTILDLSTFEPMDLVGAPALARNEPLMRALARLRAALKTAPTAPDHAEIIHTAFEIGEKNGLLLQVALLFGDDAASIIPAPDWSNWSELMVRGLLLAGRPESAARWASLLTSGANATSELSGQLQIVFALAAPNFADAAKVQQLLVDLANAANPKPPSPPPEPPPPEPMIDPMTGQLIPVPAPPPPPPPPPKPPEAVIARATLDLGLLDAVGRMLPMDARESVAPLMMQQSKGRRPPPALMARIAKASLTGGIGETALSVIVALGRQGAGDLAPDVVVNLVRALKTAGQADAALALATEALLLRPGGGVGG